MDYVKVKEIFCEDHETCSSVVRRPCGHLRFSAGGDWVAAARNQDTTDLRAIIPAMALLYLHPSVFLKVF